MLWGGFHGILLLLEKKKKQHRKRSINNYIVLGWKWLYTNCVVVFAWILFRAQNIKEAGSYIINMFGKIFTERICIDLFKGVGLDYKDLVIAFLAVILLFVIDLIQYKKQIRIDTFLRKKGTVVRWIFCVVMITTITIWGKYGPNVSSTSFIYFQF